MNIKIRSRRFRQISLVAFCSLGLIGCAVGPDFRTPDAPTTPRYTASPLPDKTVEAQGVGGGSQSFVPGKDIPPEWWALFHSKALDQLIRQAFTDSPTLESTKARLRVVKENLQSQKGVLFPSVDAAISVSRQKISGASTGQQETYINPFTLINASISVAYALDIFGGARRQLEALEAGVEYQRFQLEGAYLTLASNIVTTVFKEASLRMQIQATRQVITILEQNLQIMEKRLDIGVVSLSDVLAQRTQLAQVKATLPTLEGNLAQARNQLSVLIGKLPSDAQIAEFDLDQMQLPTELPVSISSDLVRQRPDIRAAEAQLHAASAEVGVATARLYPQITLTAGYGSNASTVSNLFDGPSTIYNFGAGLLQPVFQGGALTAQRRAAIAAYDQAYAQYRETVLESFQNVADVLNALEADARTLQALSDAEATALSALELTKQQFELGAVSYLLLLNAQRQYQDARINMIRAKAGRFADTVALFQALGGGWWNKSKPEDATALLNKE